jgi:hypothetical protein
VRYGAPWLINQHPKHSENLSFLLPWLGQRQGGIVAPPQTALTVGDRGFSVVSLVLMRNIKTEPKK